MSQTDTKIRYVVFTIVQIIKLMYILKHLLLGIYGIKI